MLGTFHLVLPSCGLSLIPLSPQSKGLVKGHDLKKKEQRRNSVALGGVSQPAASGLGFQRSGLGLLPAWRGWEAFQTLLAGKKCWFLLSLPSLPLLGPLDVLNASLHGLMENFTLMQSIT